MTRNKPAHKRPKAKWTFAVYYMRDKGQTLSLLCSLTDAARDYFVTHLQADMPCMGCAGLYDFLDRTTPHVFVFAVHETGTTWTGTLCKGCVDREGGNRDKVLGAAIGHFKAMTGENLDLDSIRIREKEASDAALAVLESIRGKVR